MNYLAVFTLYFITDWCSSRWATACAEYRSRHAAGWMGIYHFLHTLGVLLVVADYWCLLPLALGGFCGTYFSVHQKIRRHRWRPEGNSWTPK